MIDPKRYYTISEIASESGKSYQWVRNVLMDCKVSLYKSGGKQSVRAEDKERITKLFKLKELSGMKVEFIRKLPVYFIDELLKHVE